MKTHNEDSPSLLLSILDDSNPFDDLKEFLDKEGDIPQTCNLQLKTRLAHFTTQSINVDLLGTQEVSTLQLILHTIQHLAGFDEYPQGLQVLVECGLPNLINVLEKSLQLILEHCNDSFDGLYEMVLESIVACAEYSESVRSVMLQQFLDRLLQVVTSPGFRFTSKFETIKSVNLVLEVCPAEVRNALTKSKEHCELMREVATLIPKSGDYEYQVALTECLCRLVLKSQRNAYSKTWFTDSAIRKEFLKVKDSHFEEDCRCFLNTVNKGHQSVLSFPCRHTFLGNYEIFKPDDPDCTKFWVDFNLCSQRITLFCQQQSTAGQDEEDDNLWQTVSIWDDNVFGYTIKENDKCVVLHIQTQENCKELIGFGPYFVDNNVFIEFDAGYPVIEAVTRTLQSEKHPVRQRKQPKVSVAMTADPKSTPNSEHCDSINQMASLSGKISEKIKKKPKVSIPDVQKTPIKSNPASKTELKEQMSKESVTPKRNSVKPKRVKTPLQMVDSPAVSSRNPLVDQHKPKSKVSVAITAIDKKSLVEQETSSSKKNAHERLMQQKTESINAPLNDDQVIPSSAPEEQMMTVPDSQPSYLQNLQALTVNSRPTRNNTKVVNDSGVYLDVTDETVDGLNSSSEKMSQFKHELQKMDSDFTTYPKNVHKVSTTPCLSTVSEESGQGSSKCGSQQAHKQRLNTIEEVKGPTESDAMCPITLTSRSKKKKMSNGMISNGERQEKPVCMSPDSTSAEIVCSGGGSQDLFVTQQDKLSSSLVDGGREKMEEMSRASQQITCQRQTRSKRNKNVGSQVEENGQKHEKVRKKGSSKSKNTSEYSDSSVNKENDNDKTSVVSTSTKDINIDSASQGVHRNVPSDDEFAKPLPVPSRKKKENRTEEAVKLENRERKKKSVNINKKSDFDESASESRKKRKHSAVGEIANDEEKSPQVINLKDCEFVKPFPVSGCSKTINNENDSHDASNNEICENTSVYNFSPESLYSSYSQDPCLMTRNKLAGINLCLDREESKLSLKNTSISKSAGVKPRFFKARAKERQDTASQSASDTKDEECEKEKLCKSQQKILGLDKSFPKQQSHKNQNKAKVAKQKAGKAEKLSKICGKLKNSTSEKFEEDINNAFGFDENSGYKSPAIAELSRHASSKDTTHAKPSEWSTKISNRKVKKNNNTSPILSDGENNEGVHIEDSETTEKDVKNNAEDAVLDDISSNACGVISDFAKLCQNIISESATDKSKRSKRIQRKVNYKDPAESDLEFESTYLAEEKLQQPNDCDEVKYSDYKNIQDHETSKRSKKGRRHIFSDTGDDTTFETRSEVSWIVNSSSKKKPKIDKTYPAKHIRDHTESSTKTGNIDNETDDSASENYTERPHKPPQKGRTKRKKQVLSVRNEEPDFSSLVDQEDSLYLFADVPIKQKQGISRVKPSQQPKRKKPRNTSVKEKSKQKQVPAEPYEEALDETLIVESKDKTPKEQPKRSFEESGELEQTIQNLCTASLQALTRSKKAKKTTSCVVNEICSEDFATELRSLFDKAIIANKIVETPKTRTADAKKKEKQLKKTPNQVKTKKYKKLDVQITKTPLIGSVCRGMVEDEVETFRFEENLNNVDSVTISPIMPIFQSTTVKPNLKQHERQKTKENSNKHEENPVQLHVTEETEEQEENVQLSQNSNFSHISSLKTPKTPFNTKDVEIADTEDHYNSLLYKDDLKSGPCKRKKKRNNYESEESDVTLEELDNEGIVNEFTAKAAPKMLKPRQLFSSYLQAECPQSDSEKEEEEESEEEEEIVQDQAPQVSETSLFKPDYTDTTDLSLHSNVKSMIQAFGTDIQRNLMTKTKFIEGLAKASLRVTQKQIGKTWNKQNLRRHEVLEDFKQTLVRELKLLEEEVVNIKQAESKVLECFKSTMEVIQISRQSQEKRLQNLSKAQNEFEEEMTGVEESLQTDQDSLQENMRKEMINLQKKILLQSQQQEISNVKKTLSAMFL